MHMKKQELSIVEERGYLSFKSKIKHHCSTPGYRCKKRRLAEYQRSELKLKRYIRSPPLAKNRNYASIMNKSSLCSIFELITIRNTVATVTGLTDPSLMFQKAVHVLTSCEVLNFLDMDPSLKIIKTASFKTVI